MRLTPCHWADLEESNQFAPGVSIVEVQSVSQAFHYFNALGATDQTRLATLVILSLRRALCDHRKPTVCIKHENGDAISRAAVSTTPSVALLIFCRACVHRLSKHQTEIRALLKSQVAAPE